MMLYIVIIFACIVGTAVAPFPDVGAAMDKVNNLLFPEKMAIDKKTDAGINWDKDTKEEIKWSNMWRPKEAFAAQSVDAGMYALYRIDGSDYKRLFTSNPLTPSELTFNYDDFDWKSTFIIFGVQMHNVNEVLGDETVQKAMTAAFADHSEDNFMALMKALKENSNVQMVRSPEKSFMHMVILGIIGIVCTVSVICCFCGCGVYACYHYGSGEYQQQKQKNQQQTQKNQQQKHQQGTGYRDNHNQNRQHQNGQYQNGRSQDDRYKNYYNRGSPQTV